jgi:hypothetical protein
MTNDKRIKLSLALESLIGFMLSWHPDNAEHYRIGWRSPVEF